MRHRLLNSLLELAHATSENLAFAHKSGVHVSYGEETITETNLLELRRRHPGAIKLRTFSRGKEAKNGADWEWHIIGRERTFGMRVQAKRIQKDNKLKIQHTVRSTGKDQIELLIDSARKHGLMPVYCLYSSEKQRSKWSAGKSSSGTMPFEFGCLLASAYKVRAKMPKALESIESDCIPWHYLIDQRRFHRSFEFDDSDGRSYLQFRFTEGIPRAPIAGQVDPDEASTAAFPTIDDLNDPESDFRDREGIFEGSKGSAHAQAMEEIFLERGISKLLEIDVTELPLSEDG